MSALLFALAFPPVSWRLLAWVAVAPFLFAVRTSSWKGAAGLAVLWSLAAMCAGVTDWLVDAVAVYYLQPRLLGVAMLVGETLRGATWEYVLFALAYRRAARLRPALAVPIAGAAWVAAELARTRIFYGNPWGVFGYSQGGVLRDVGSAWWALPLQVADLGGVYAVSFVLVVVNAAVAELALACFRPAARVWPFAAAAWAGLVAGFAVLYGGARTAGPDPTEEVGGRIAVVQGNLDLGSQWRSDLYGKNLTAYLRLTREVAQQADPEVVFWPENAMTFFVDEEPDYRQAIARAMAPFDVQVVGGAPRIGADPQTPRHYNSAFVIDPSGAILDRYDKRRLFPFVEYFPLPTQGLLRRSFGRVREFSPGEASAPLATRVGRAGVLICNEAMYPEDAVARVREGAGYLLNLTNDTWVASAEFAEHQLNIASLRAVEQERDLVRASTSGPSAIVDRFGRVVSRTETGAQAVLVGEIATRSRPTIYTRVGDLFAWLCVSATLLATVGSARRGEVLSGRWRLH